MHRATDDRPGGGWARTVALPVPPKALTKERILDPLHSRQVYCAIAVLAGGQLLVPLLQDGPAVIVGWRQAVPATLKQGARA
jgi:hypothetical protein